MKKTYEFTTPYEHIYSPIRQTQTEKYRIYRYRTRTAKLQNKNSKYHKR